MAWIIVLAVVVVLVVVLWGTKRAAVLKSKTKLEQDIEHALTSFGELTGKIRDSDLKDHEKKILTKNIEGSIETLERWKSSTLPNITLWKNHTAPLEKELADLRENVARDLASYEGLPDPLA